MFRCPYCENKGISSLRKLILGPGSTATCVSCGEPCGVGYLSWLIAILPGSILMIAAMFVDSETAEWSLNIAGLILMIILPFLFTSLHRAK